MSVDKIEKGTYGTAVKAAVLVLMIGQYANSMLSGITGVLAAEFGPDLSKIISSMNYLACSVPLIFMEPLSARFTKKQLSLAGIVLILAGVIPAFVYGKEVLLATQFVCGMGIGLMYAFAASYIIDLWDGEEANRMMGNRSTIGAIAGIAYVQWAGIAGSGGNYQPAFYCLLVMIPVLLLCLKLPRTYPVEIADKEARAAAKASNAPKTRKMYVMTWCLCVFTVVVLTFASSMMIGVGIVAMSPVEAGGLGVATSSTVGNIMTCFSVAMMISGILYARVWVKLFKTFTTAAGVALLTVGMLILCSAGSVPLLIAGAVVFGFGFQIYNGHIMQLIPMTTVPTGATFAISMFFVFTNIGSFLAAIVPPAISKIVFSSAETLSVRSDWYVALVGLAVCAVVEFIFCKKINDNVKAGVLQ